jgi:hypothetical protein
MYFQEGGYSDQISNVSFLVLGKILKHGSLLFSTFKFRIYNNVINFVRRFITKGSLNNPIVSHIINLRTCNEIIILICLY